MTLKKDAPAQPVAAVPVPAQAVLDPAPLPDQDEDTHAQALAIVAAADAQLRALLAQDPAKLSMAISNREMLVAKIREVAIRRTTPMDWTGYKDREGRVVFVPRASALSTIRVWLGIDVFNHRPLGPNGPEPQIEYMDVPVKERDEKGQPVETTKKVLTATMWADAVCQLTARHLPGIQFTARQDRFSGSGTLDDLRASARTGVDSKATKVLAGITKVSAEELAKYGIDIGATYKGHGFGTAQDRDASRVSDPALGDRRAKLWTEIQKRTAGDQDAARDLLREITYWTKDGKEGYAKSVEQLTAEWQIEKAEKKLREHPVFGDKATSGSPGPAKSGARGRQSDE